MVRPQVSPASEWAQAFAANTEISSLKRAWGELTGSFQSPIGSYEWIAASAEHLSADSDLALIVSYAGAAVSGVAALARRRGQLAPYEHIGVDAHGEPMDFYYRDASALAQLAKKIAESDMSLYLPKLPVESPVYDALRSAYRGRGIVFVRPAQPCPFLPLQSETADGLERLSSSLKSDLRRGQRKAAALGPVGVEFRSPTNVQELSPLWETLLQLESTGWKGQSRTALAYDQRMRTFFHAYALEACKSGILQIATLKIGDRSVASHLAIESNNRLWLLKIAYDEQFSKCSPGLLLMAETLQYATKKGLESIEFLGAAAPWTRRWTKHERQNVSVRVYVWSPTGMLMLARDGLSLLLRRARQFISSSRGASPNQTDARSGT